MHRILPLAILALAGCHETCGTMSPFWVMADCAIVEISDDCELELTFMVDDADDSLSVGTDDTVTLRAVATNLTDEDLSFDLVQPCPDGLADFSGLGDHGYYGSCLAGDCFDSGAVFTQTVGAGESLEITTTVALGGDDCNDAVAPGSYDLTFDLPWADTMPTTCQANVVELTVE